MQFPSSLSTFVAFIFCALAVHSLKFELYAQHQGQNTHRCIRNWVGPDTLVVVTAIVSGHKGDGQRVNIDVHTDIPEHY